MKAKENGAIPRLFSLMATSICLLSLRLVLMGNKTPDFSSSDNPAANSDSLLTRTLTFLYLPAFNFWLLLCPTTLSFDWSMDTIPLLQSIFDWRNVYSIIFYSSLLTIGITAVLQLNNVNYSLMIIEPNANYKEFSMDGHRLYNGMNGSANGTRKRNINRSKQMSPKERRKNLDKTATTDEVFMTSYDCQSFLVSMAILILPFIPASNLFFYVGFVVAERVLYIPSVGFCIMVSIGLDILARCCSRNGKRFVYCCVCAMTVLFALRTIHRNMDWKDGETLYRSVVEIII